MRSIVLEMKRLGREIARPCVTSEYVKKQLQSRQLIKLAEKLERKIDEYT